MVMKELLEIDWMKNDLDKQNPLEKGTKVQTEENEFKIGWRDTWLVDNWLKVVFNDKSKPYIGQDNNF